MMRKAIILFSGGLDSCTALAVAIDQGFAPWLLSFDYGQRHRVELEAARRIAAHYRINSHKTIQVDLASVGGSALTANIDVPKHRTILDHQQYDNPMSIPVTYVPARNAIFLSLAASWAEVVGAEHLFAGMNALDYSGYPDCRPDFLQAFEAMINLGTRQGRTGRKIIVETPLIALSKAEIIRLGTRLQAPYQLTHSCYDPVDAQACGACDSCQLRRRGFIDAGVVDPTDYVSGD